MKKTILFVIASTLFPLHAAEPPSANPPVAGTDGRMDRWREARFGMFIQVRELKPNIITNNRLGGGFDGDTETPEQHIPPQGYPGRDWETCMTMNGTWGYKHWDHDWKSPETLIRNLIDIASKGGNYLLNDGLDGLGEIPAPSVRSLAAMGEWMKVNGEAVYGTGPTAFGTACFGPLP